MKAVLETVHRAELARIKWSRVILMAVAHHVQVVVTLVNLKLAVIQQLVLQLARPAHVGEGRG